MRLTFLKKLVIFLKELILSTKSKLNKVNPIYVCLLVITFLIIPDCITYKYRIINGDVAEYVNNPVRIINGELPYRDFWLLFPPGEVFFPASIYKLFGININILLFITSVIIPIFFGISVFILGKEIFKDNFYSSLFTILIFYYFEKISFFYYEGLIYLLLLIISFYFFIKYLKQNENKRLFLLLTSFFIGLAFLFRIYLVGACLSAYVLSIILIRQKNFKNIIKDYCILLSNILVIWGITIILLSNIWKVMLKEIFIESVSHGTSMNLPYFYSCKIIINTLKSYIFHLSFHRIHLVIYYIFNLVNFTILYLLPFIIMCISIIYLFFKKLELKNKYIIISFLTWGILSLPKSLGRSDIFHLFKSLFPFLLLMFFILKLSIKDKNNIDKLIKYGFIIIIISFFLSFPFDIFYRIKNSIIRKNYKVITKYGTLYFHTKETADKINKIINIINKYTKEKDYIFVTPWYAPPLYALTNRRNPTYYDSLIDVIIRPSKEKQLKICYDIINKNTKLIIHYPYWGFDRKKNFKFLNACPLIHKFIENNFKLIAKYRKYWIYISKKY